MKKFAGLLTAAVLTALTLTGCAGSEAAGSADATAEHPLVLNLAHNLVIRCFQCSKTLCRNRCATNLFRIEDFRLNIQNRDIVLFP